MEALVTDHMLWILAFPDLVAFGSWSMELGDMKIYLNAWRVVIFSYNIDYLSSDILRPKFRCVEGHSMDLLHCKYNLSTGK